MSFTVYDGVLAYAKRANHDLYLACRTSIFNDPENQVYTIKGKKTAVRQYSAGKAGNYDTNKGFMQTYGTGQGVKWVEYGAQYDRAKVLKVDAAVELPSYQNGMTPSIVLLNSDFFNNHMADEIDAANIAQFYDRVPDSNIKESTDYGTSVDGILDTILRLETDIFNTGYAGKSVLFMRGDIYKNFQTAIINHNGLASGELIKRKLTVNIDTEFGKFMADADDKLSVDVDIEEFDNFYIIKLPDHRMYNLITMLDGVSAGQTAGGYIPDTSDPDFALIDLVAIPFVAAFTNVRYCIDNLLVPAAMPISGFTQLDLEKLNGRMFHNVEIGNAGINQKGNDFEYDIRIIYGGDIYDNRRRNCFAVVHSEAPTLTDLTVAGEDTVVTDSTATYTATASPEGAVTGNIVWSVAPGTGTATITSAGVLTGGEAGTVTVIAAAPNGVVGLKSVTVTSV